MKRYTNLSIYIARAVLLFALVFLGTSLHMYGQVLDAVTPSIWSISSHSDVDNGTDYNRTSTVELGTNELQWKTSPNSTLPFTITGSSGNWDKQANTGEIQLSVTMDTSSGTVTINGDDTGISILIDLVYENGSSKLRLQVNQVEYK